MKTKLITSLALLLLTPQAMAYTWEKPIIVKNNSPFCAVTERQVGYDIDAFYYPDSNKIYPCFEETDTQEWRDYAITHEMWHAFYYKSFNDTQRDKIKQLYELKPKYGFSYVNDYAKKNVDEFFAETRAKILSWQYEINGKTDVEKAFQKKMIEVFNTFK